MVGEKKKTSRKMSPPSDEASPPAAEKKRAARKEAVRKSMGKSVEESMEEPMEEPMEESMKASSREARKESPTNKKQGKDKGKEKGKDKGKEKGEEASLVVRRQARTPPASRTSRTPSSVVQEMAREKEGSLLTTRASPPSPSRSRTATGARKGARKETSQGGRPSVKGYWQGQMLLASPAIGDQRFERSVIYLCHQGEDGALGLVVNKIAEKIQFTDVLDHLNIPFASSFARISVHVGGPVESSRGFVLHSPEKMFAGTIELGDLAMTASADILKKIAEGKGPKDYVFLLGYAGWGTGQLDKEIERNAWLHLPFDHDLVFGEDDQDKWARAMQKLGVSPHLLSGASGNA